MFVSLEHELRYYFVTMFVYNCKSNTLVLPLQQKPSPPFRGNQIQLKSTTKMRSLVLVLVYNRCTEANGSKSTLFTVIYYVKINIVMEGGFKL
ncbi:hypothetical protein LguiB_019672 [Lonicera macranthoides]